METKKNNHSISEIKVGDKITLVRSVGPTIVEEVVVKEITNNSLYYVDKSKRKMQAILAGREVLFFKGHGLSILSVSQVINDGRGCFRSIIDFMINIGGMPSHELKSFIEKNNLNENFAAWKKLMYWTKDSEQGIPLYP